MAFSVDGSGYSRDDLNAIVTGLGKADQVTVRNDAIAGEDMRSFVSAMIRYQATENVLASLGKSITDADRKAMSPRVLPSLPKDLDGKVIDLLVEISTMSAAIDSLPAPDDAAIQALYESSPASSGFLCVRQITVKTKDQAVEIARKLSDGAKFTDLVASSSTDKASKSNGGAVIGLDNSPCTEVAAADDDASIGRELAEALIDTSLTGNTGAVKDSKGWHVAIHRPWSEIKDAVVSGFSAKPGSTYVSGALATADVQLNSVYGTWNRVAAKVE